MSTATTKQQKIWFRVYYVYVLHFAYVKKGFILFFNTEKKALNVKNKNANKSKTKNENSNNQILNAFSQFLLAHSHIHENETS